MQCIAQISPKQGIFYTIGFATTQTGISAPLTSLTALLVCLGVGTLLGPNNVFNLLGTTGTFVYIPVFILMNLAAYRFFREQRPSEFNFWSQLLLPVLSTAALLFIGYNSMVPLPAAPIVFAPLLTLFYLAVGLGILFGRTLRPGQRAWRTQAGNLPEVS
ncbi:hypothetical protein E7T06_08490 [Deinococcus sp. Arct2-2]|uniref:hypothetical protein n=1 Tax=Deinococcus sp. Arct2-2 TaxID=2568653 RepID=UPI0010A4F265|nr:hypothetical protein [Deinococcus sp. Arct2-2]THF70214.1 hypothetical protein E7T06_08490 [Deinococcus sp. Arct2-2]